jgi:hypothetical protein
VIGGWSSQASFDWLIWLFFSQPSWSCTKKSKTASISFYSSYGTAQMGRTVSRSTPGEVYYLFTLD